MIILELSRDECLSLLKTGRVGRLAMTDGGQPYVVPISFAFDGEALYGFTLPGRKLELMRADARVALLVESHAADGAWQSVLVEGRFEELPDAVGTKREREKAIQALIERPDWWLPGALKPMYPPQVDDRRHVFFRIRIERLSGRQARALEEEGNESISAP